MRGQLRRLGRSATGRRQLAADVEADQLWDLGHSRGDLAWGPTGHLGLLLGEDAEADRLAADPVEGLGRDARRGAVDEGQAARLVAAVEGEGGEGAADHVA